MRFKGLAKNDPSRAQYQLWIFDKTRDEKYPVDGGVFDVDSDTGDVVVPSRATLPVNAPVLFAVTLERPGGVVVSKREHIVVTAKMPADVTESAVRPLARGCVRRRVRPRASDRHGCRARRDRSSRGAGARPSRRRPSPA